MGFDVGGVDHQSLKISRFLRQRRENPLENPGFGPVDRQGMFTCPKGGVCSGYKASWPGHIQTEHPPVMDCGQSTGGQRTNDNRVAGKR